MFDILINYIQSKFAENNFKILDAFKNCLNTKNNRDENILGICNTYNIDFNDLKAELKRFGKMC